MTDKDLEAIEYRLDLITPFPWRVDEAATYDPQEVGICSEQGDPRLAFTSWDRFVVCYGDEDKPTPGHQVALANATFIAHAPEDMAALLDEVYRLKRELQYAQESVTSQIQVARRAGAESMRAAIGERMQTLWDRGAANIVAAVPVPESL